MIEDDLKQLAIRIDTTARKLCGENPTPQELYEAQEVLCIQILDSEYMDYPEGELESFLIGYLEEKRLKK